MKFSLALAAAALLSLTEAKVCYNITIPLNITARNAVFSINQPTSPMEATYFAQQYTVQGNNFSQMVTTGYQNIMGAYNISAKFCRPDNATATNISTVQFLTHGIGFDKSYWDLPYNGFNYSYTNVAVDQFGYSTLAIDRFGIGNSSHADPVSVVQAPAELNAIYQITMMLRNGTVPGLNSTRAQKVVHVGHSFGSGLSYTLASMYPTVSDGLILTGFSLNSSFLNTIIASWDLKIASLNQPFRFGSMLNMSTISSVLNMYGLLDLPAGLTPTAIPQNLPSGYLTWADLGANQFAFLYPPGLDPAIGPYLETTKQPVTYGEILTLTGTPMAAAQFKGPVQIVTGNNDAIYCGGNCSNSGGSGVSIPAMVGKAFPMSRNFTAYIQPSTGHAVNVHYNSTAAFQVIQRFLMSNGL